MRKNIAVIFGGRSDEYDVSLNSAASVIDNLDKVKYNILPLGITKSGEWFYYDGNTKAIRDDSWQDKNCTRALLSPAVSDGLLLFCGTDIKRIPIDCALPIMHGKNSEDGTIQGLIELSGIKLLGSGVLSSALCMDKHRAHLLAEANGIRAPKSVILEENGDLNPALDLLRKIKTKIVVKPLRSGSSLGISIAHNEYELKEAIKYARQFDELIIAEEFIEGNEVGCAIVGTKNLITGEVDEIELKEDIFDYKEKYAPADSIVQLPARVFAMKREQIKETAKKIYTCLGCGGFARVDMFLTPQGDLVFNEVNTIPGFTENSRFPKMMNAAGYSMRELLNLIVENI